MSDAPSATRRPGRRRRRRLPHLAKGQRQVLAVVLAAAVAQLSAARPVGQPILDGVWLALVAGGTAYLAGTAKRVPLIAATVVVTITSQSVPAVALGVAAVVVASLSTLRVRRRAVFSRGSGGGLAAASLLVSADHRPGWHSVLLGLLFLGVVGASGLRHAPSGPRRAVLWGGAGVLGFGLVAGGVAGVVVAQQASTVDLANQELEFGLAAARAGQPELAAGHLGRAATLADQAGRRIDRFGRAGRLVPGVAQHVEAVGDVLRRAAAVAEQAALTAGLVRDDDLVVRAGRLDLDAVRTVAAPLRRLGQSLTALTDELDEHRHDPLVAPLRDRLAELRRAAGRAEREAWDGAEAAAVLPEVLGADGERRYLVLFTSPAEARGRFGFPGSFAEVLVRDGRLLLGEQGTSSAVLRATEYDQAGFDTTDPRLAPYLAYGTTQSFLSATIPPDFPVVAAVAAEQWRQSGRPPVDGVLRFDPASLAPLLAITGAVDVGGVPDPLTPDNLEQFLVFDQYVQFPRDQAPRREVLETVADVTFDRLVNADLPAPRTLASVYAPLAEAGHFDVAVFGDGPARLMRRLGLDGTFRAPAGDGVAVLSVNAVGNKIDTFLTKAVTYDAEVTDLDRTRGDALLRGTLRVQATNAAPPRGLPTYVIGSATDPPLDRGTNRTTLLLYTRTRPTEVVVDGVARPAPTVVAADRWLTALTVDLPPGAAVDVVLRLEGRVPLDDGRYRLVVEPGGGATPDDYRIAARVDGRTHEHAGRVRSPLSVG